MWSVLKKNVLWYLLAYINKRHIINSNVFSTNNCNYQYEISSVLFFFFFALHVEVFELELDFHKDSVSCNWIHKTKASIGQGFIKETLNAVKTTESETLNAVKTTESMVSLLKHGFNNRFDIFTLGIQEWTCSLQFCPGTSKSVNADTAMQKSL